MERKMILISDDSEFIVTARAFCESKGGTIKVYSSSEWAKNSLNPSFFNSLSGNAATLSVGQHPINEGAKILQFPHGGVSNHSASENRVATMNELESVAIQNAIQNFNGNLTEAAKALGIGRATLYRKVKQYNIDPSTARRKKVA